MDATRMPQEKQTTSPGGNQQAGSQREGVSVRTVATGAAGGLGGAVRATSGVTLLSRFGGLVREVLVSRVFGDTALGSAFAAAFQIPNLFRRLFGEGALSAAFIPLYTAASERDAERSKAGSEVSKGTSAGESGQLASLTVMALGAVTWGLTVVSEVVLLLVLLLGTHSADREILLRLVMVMLPFMPMICTAAILAGMLQVHGRFGPASSGPLVLNAFMIIAAVYMLGWGKASGISGETVAYVFGVATVLSGGTQCIWFARLLRLHMTWTRQVREAVPAARVMGKRFVPVAIGLGTLQLSTFIDTLICTYTLWAGPTILGWAFPLQDKSNVIVTAAQRLYQFPLGVFGIAVATAVFPMLSRHAGAKHWEGFRDTLWRGVRLSMFIAVPASVGLLLVRGEISYVLYIAGGGGTSGGGSGSGGGGGVGGGFSLDGVRRVASVLLGYAPGIWMYSINHVLARAYYSRGDTKTPMLVSIAMIVVNLSLTMTLIWWFEEAGLAWATTMTAGVQMAMLIVMARRWRVVDGPEDKATLGGRRRDTARSLVKTAVCTAVMAGVVLITKQVVPGAGGWAGGAWMSQFVSLIAQTVAGGVAYVIAAKAVRSHELNGLLRRGAGRGTGQGQASD